ncbi:hypothetical protein QTP70_023295 [Hemibagrus guttatus]|uniref:Epithelial membrane protein 2 n=1 Tax=Hemibagrus guttatus TaxID=175788 RepID=A0AAE0UWG3_9TELE|nr:hypothetical protein QTP70_023295 [Hemibagrus guttatus]
MNRRQQSGAFRNTAVAFQQFPHLSDAFFFFFFFFIFFFFSFFIFFVLGFHSGAWWFTTNGNFYTDLWYMCNVTCVDIPGSASGDSGFLQAVQAAMILATILCCVDFFVFILQLFRLKQGERFVFTAIIQLLSSLCVMIAASIYTAERTSFQEKIIQQGD